MMGIGEAPETDSSVYLHVGMSKTGTTAIQRFLYENADAMSRVGVCYPDNYRDVDRGFEDWAHHILSHKWGGWLDPAVFPVSPEQAWEQLDENIAERTETIILSSERFQDLLVQSNYAKILKYVQNMVAPRRLRIIGYVRRQDDFAESHFKELVKNSFNKTSLDDYVKDLPAFYDYNAFFGRCAEVVGAENVIVRVFDERCFVGGSLIEDFAYACGFAIPEDAVSGESITNISLNSAYARVMSEHKVRPLWREQVFRSELFAFFKEWSKRQGRVAPLLGHEQRRWIMDRFEESNSRLLGSYIDEASAKFFTDEYLCEDEAFDIDELMFSSRDLIRILSSASGVARRLSERLKQLE